MIVLGTDDGTCVPKHVCNKVESNIIEENHYSIHHNELRRAT